MHATTQGESNLGVQVTEETEKSQGKKPMDFELLGDQDATFDEFFNTHGGNFDQVFKDLGLNSDSSDDVDDLEEGEFIPDEIVDWKSDDEVLPDPDVDINEHVVEEQQTTDVVIDEDLGEVLDNIRGRVEYDIEDSSFEGDMSDNSMKSLKSLWWDKKTKTKELTMRKLYDVSQVRELSKGIISWFYDKELNLFVIKRFDGL